MSEMQHYEHKESKECEWQPREQPVLALGMGHYEGISEIARLDEAQESAGTLTGDGKQQGQEKGRSGDDQDGVH